MMGYPKTALSKFPDIAKTLLNKDSLDIFTFVSCDRKTPIAMLIKLITGDRFSHAGFVISVTSIYDSRSDGVAFRSLLDIIGQADDFAIVRFRFKGDEHRKEFERDVERLLGRPYDFTQELGGESLYCSELIYTLLKGRVEEEISERFFQGQRGFSPGDVYTSGHVVFDHNPRY